MPVTRARSASGGTAETYDAFETYARKRSRGRDEGSRSCASTSAAFAPPNAAESLSAARGAPRSVRSRRRAGVSGSRTGAITDAGRTRAIQRVERGERLEHAGRAERVADLRLERVHHRVARDVVAERRDDRLPLGRVVERRRRPVRAHDDPRRRASAERARRGAREARARAIRRGDVDRVARRAEAGDETERALSPASRSRTSATSAAPSPSDMPSRSRPKGRDGSFAVVARSASKPLATKTLTASKPPAMTRSHAPPSSQRSAEADRDRRRRARREHERRRREALLHDDAASARNTSRARRARRSAFFSA